MDVMAARGCDGLLTRLAMELVERGVVLVPEVGRTVHRGDILMKRRAEERGLGVRYYG